MASIRWKPVIVGLAVLLIGLGLTAGLTRFHATQNRYIAEQQLALRGLSLADTVAQRIDNFRHGLLGLRGALSISEDRRLSYREYVKAVNLEQEYPGSLAFGFAQRVTQEQVPDLLEKIGRDVRLEAVEVNRGDRYLVVESSGDVKPGVDLASLPMVRATGLRATWTGDVALSPPIAAIDGKSASFFYLAPVYKNGVVPETIHQREHLIEGWLYIHISGERLMAGISDESLAFKLIDHDNPDEDFVVFESDKAMFPASEGGAPALHGKEFQLKFGGRHWSLVVKPLPPFWTALGQVPVFITLLIGVVVSTLAALLSFILLSSQFRAEKKALAMTLALRESEERVRTILDYASIGIGFSRNQLIVHCNPKFAEIFGWASAEAMAGLPGATFWPDAATYAEVGRSAGPVLAGGGVYDTERPMRRQDGSLFMAHVVAKAIDPAFPDRGTIWLTDDVTEKLAAQRSIRESREQLAQIVNASPIASFVLDAGHRVIYWNPACVTLTGIDAEKMLGSTEVWRAFYSTQRQTMADLVLDGAPDQIIADNYELFSRSPLVNGAFQAENFFPDVGGDGRWLYFTAVPLRNSDGEITGVIETIQDVSHRRRDQKVLEDRVNERTSELQQQLHFMKQLIEAIPGPVYYKDSEGRFLGCNSAFENYAGKPAGVLVGNRTLGGAGGTEDDPHLEVDDQLLADPGKKVYERQLRYADGQTREVMLHMATFTRPDGRVGGLVGLMLDITERKRMEDDLRQAATVFENAAEGVTITAADGRIIAINSAFRAMTGYEEDELVGHDLEFLRSPHHEQAFYDLIQTIIAREHRWSGEVWCQRKSSEVFPAWVSIAAVYDSQHRIASYVATSSDISRQKENERRIERLAFSDSLTELPNRRLLRDRLQSAVASCAREGVHGALLFIDLDDFKTLNDTLGHDIGDLLLQQVAESLLTCVRETDTVARLGGDEFVILLERLSTDSLDAAAQAESVGRKIIATISRPYQLGSYTHRTTPSIGVALFSEFKESIDELLKQADLAMYEAKASGRNTMCFFNPAMEERISRRVALEAELRDAIIYEKLELYYQAQVVGDGRLTGAEVLLRWRHAERGMISPAEFIPLAEDTGLILPLGHWVMQTACTQLAIWAKQPEMAHLTVSVNVSARQFSQPNFVEEVESIVAYHGIQPQRLKLELTESLLVSDVEEIIVKMSALKAKGVGFSLDDFGTGYSSLSYLKRLPLDQLKIDQGFVKDILTDPNDAAIAKMVIALSESMGLAVIAEGVEIKAQADFLSHLGCHAYQGYLFSRPLPVAEFEIYAQTL